MKFICGSVAVACLAMAASAQTMGWRGDGGGCYPAANPPTQWGKLSPVLAGLTCQAKKPIGDKPGTSAAYMGMVTEWLVVGPLKPNPAATTKPIDESLIGDELKAEPDEGQKVQDAAWTVLKPDAYVIDLAERLGKDAGAIAYAHSYLHAAQEGKVTFSCLGYSDAKVWVNGQLVFPSKTVVVTLTKGWNRILVKAVQGPQKGPYEIWPSLWHFAVMMTAAAPYEARQTNIAWSTPLPSWSTGAPVIAGDRMYVVSEPNDVVCLNKADGKLLWLRSSNFFDALSDEEKKSDVMKDVADLSAKLKQINDLFGTATPPDAKQMAEKAKLQGEIVKQMGALDKQKYIPDRMNELHGSCLPTPATDGKNVFVWHGNGVAASYDRDGNRKWIQARKLPIKHHGFNSSPLLVDGKLICYMRQMFAFDAQTGKELWAIDAAKGEEVYGDNFHSTPVLFEVGKGKYLYVNGMIIRPSDAKMMWEGKDWKESATIPSPVVAGGVVFDVGAGGRLKRGKLPADEESMKMVNDSKVVFFTKGGGSAYTRTFVGASPLVYDGLLYLVDVMGNLKVYDASTLEKVYEKNLAMGYERGSNVHSMGVVYASPILAGKRLYILGMQGVMVVIEPGREYKEVARNKIEALTGIGQWYEKPEGFSANPVAEGDCLYLRGDGFLYCIKGPQEKGR